jgi:putative DNA methylase
MSEDIRLIEDYIPIEEISAEARREKSIRKGHISTLHLWWARRPLVAARAAVYGALVPAPKDKKERKAADEFVKKLCKYPGSPDVFQQAQGNILRAHAERLTAEYGELVTVEDIEAGRAPRPRVLDMFAGGGAIPLEALRLGCEAYALDLNPVAHLIELCTLVYPQRYSAPDPSAKGCAADGTWAGLDAEVGYWGTWVLEQVRLEIGDLYPSIPDPEAQHQIAEPKQLNMNLAVPESRATHGKGMLTPVAYLWTRTVTCKNAACRATVPLARLTWLATKKGRFVALQPVPNLKEKRVHYRVVDVSTERGLGFDPDAGSKGGNVGCPFCGTVADTDYVKFEGMAGRISMQIMASVYSRPGKQGKVYLPDDNRSFLPDDEIVWQRIHEIENSTKNDPCGAISIPEEEIVNDAKGSAWIVHYGFDRFSKLFTPRELLTLMTFSKWVHHAYDKLQGMDYNREHTKAITTYLGLMVDRLSDFCSALCTWNYTGGRGTKNTFARQALPMVWDFAETNPFNLIGANWQACIDAATETIKKLPNGVPADGRRGDATHLPFDNSLFDAIITDPPYYDNVPYSNISDFFYVWLKRTIGFLYPEHFSSLLTPKKKEAVADATRHQGDRQQASHAYESMMGRHSLKLPGLLRTALQ